MSLYFLSASGLSAAGAPSIIHLRHGQPGLIFNLENFSLDREQRVTEILKYE